MLEGKFAGRGVVHPNEDVLVALHVGYYGAAFRILLRIK